MFFIWSFLFFSSTKSKNRRAEQVLPKGESCHQWEEGGVEKGGEYGAKNVYTCMQMQKWYLLKLLQESGKQGIKETGRVDEFMYDIFDTL
jgi:hypothetical protein